MMNDDGQVARESLWNNKTAPISGDTRAQLVNKQKKATNTGRNARSHSQPQQHVTAQDRPITPDAFAAVLRELERAASNDDRLKSLRDALPGRLFTAKQILALLDTTPSVKTRLVMVTQLLAPRCQDPGSAASLVVGVFRFTEDKQAAKDATAPFKIKKDRFGSSVTEQLPLSLAALMKAR